MKLTQKSMSFQYKLGNAAKIMLNRLFLKKSIRMAKNMSAKMTSISAMEEKNLVFVQCHFDFPE